MQIGGPNGFKVVVTDPAAVSADEGTTSTEVTEGFDLDALMEQAEAEATETNQNLQSYGLGASEAYTGTTSTIETALSSYPPTVEEILVADPRMERHLDVIKGKYEESIAKLRQLKARYQSELFSGAPVSGDVSTLQRSIELIDQSLVRAQAELEKCQTRINQLDELYSREFIEMRDLNGDKVIGNPSDPDAIGIQENEDTGEIIYVDMASGRPIYNPIRNPNYSPSLFGGRLELASVDDDPRTINLQIRPPTSASELESSSHPQLIYVPEVMWVEREAETHEPAYDEEGGLKPFLEFDENGNQKVPGDLSHWMQVKITKVKVNSYDAGKTTDGTMLSNHKVVYSAVDSDGYETEVLTLNIRGYSVDAFDYAPGSAAVTSGGRYVAPSSLGFRITGSGSRVSPVEIDADAYRSTGRFIYDDVEAMADGLQGATRDGSASTTRETWEEDDTDEEDPDMGLSRDDISRLSWQENTSLFMGETPHGYSFRRIPDPGNDDATDEEGPYHYTSDGEHDYFSEAGEDLSRYTEAGAADTLRYHDAYISDLVEPKTYYDSDRSASGTPQFSFTTIRTGVKIDGLRGIITGSRFNDIIDIPGVDVAPSPALEGFLPPGGYRTPRRIDPEYRTIVDGGGGHNVVVGGQGNYNIMRSTLTWLDLGDNDEASITTKIGEGHQEDTPVRDPLRDVWNYVHVRGGDSVHILNPPEEITGDDNDTDTVSRTYMNDYYDIEGANGVAFANPNDDDVPEGYRSQDTWHDDAYHSEEYERARGELEESIKRMPDLSEYEATAQEFWQENGGPAAENEEEMDAFFGEMFGTIEEFGDLEAEAQNDSDDGSGGTS